MFVTFGVVVNTAKQINRQIDERILKQYLLAKVNMETSRTDWRDKHLFFKKYHAIYDVTKYNTHPQLSIRSRT